MNSNFKELLQQIAVAKPESLGAELDLDCSDLVSKAIRNTLLAAIYRVVEHPCKLTWEPHDELDDVETYISCGGNEQVSIRLAACGEDWELDLFRPMISVTEDADEKVVMQAALTLHQTLVQYISLFEEQSGTLMLTPDLLPDTAAVNAMPTMQMP